MSEQDYSAGTIQNVHMRISGTAVDMCAICNQPWPCSAIKGVSEQDQLLDELDHWRKRGLFAEEQLAAAQAEIAERDERIAELQGFRDECERQYQEQVAQVGVLMDERDTARARVRELEAALETVRKYHSPPQDTSDELMVRLATEALAASATTEPAQPDVAALERD